MTDMRVAYPYYDTPKCRLRVLFDDKGIAPRHCLVVGQDGAILGQLPVSSVMLRASVGEMSDVTLDIWGTDVRIEYLEPTA